MELRERSLGFTSSEVKDSKTVFYRKAFIGVSVLSLALFIFFGFQSLIFPQKEAFWSFQGEEFPNYQLSASSGEGVQAHSLFDSLEAKEFLVSFWATWCEPCMRELPLLERALPILKREGVEVLLVNFDGGLPEKTRREVSAWLISERSEFKTFFDFEDLFLTHLRVTGLPFSLRIRAEDKKILWMKMGELEWSDISKQFIR